MRKVSPSFGFLLFCYFFSFFGHAQTLLHDELGEKLKNIQTGTPEHVDLLHQLSNEVQAYDHRKALSYAREAHDLSVSIPYQKGIVQSLYDIGQYYFDVGDYKRAQQFFNTSVMEAGENFFDDYPAYPLLKMAQVARFHSSFDSAQTYLAKVQKIVNDRKSSDIIRSSLHYTLGNIALDLSHFDLAKRYFKESLILRESMKDSVAMAECWLTLGVIETRLYKFDSASYYFDRAFTVAINKNDKLLKLTYYISVGEKSYAQGHYKEAFQFYDHALDLIHTDNYNLYAPIILKQIGVIFRVTGDYVKGLEHLNQALALSVQTGNRQDEAQIKTSMGWLYMNQGNYELAMDFAIQGLTEMQAIHDEAGSSMSYNLKGFIYLRKKEYADAMDNFRKAFDIRSAMGLKADALSAQYNIGLTYRLMGDYAKALAIHKEVLASSESMDPRICVMVNNSTGGILLSLHNLPQAKEYLAQAMEMATQLKLPIQLCDNYKLQAQWYQDNGDYKTATKFLTDYIALNDSIFTTENKTRLAQFGALYRLEKKEREVNTLSHENEQKAGKILLQETSLNMQRNILIFSVVGIILLLIVLYILTVYYRDKHRANIELSNLNKSISEKNEEIQAQSEEITEANAALMNLNEDLSNSKDDLRMQSEELFAANEMITQINHDLEKTVDERTLQVKQALVELDTFFYRSSHDFRRPITTFLGLAEVAKITVKDPSALELFEKVSETAKNLDKMLVKLQSISDVGAQQLVLKDVSIKEMATNVMNTLLPEIVKRKIEVHYTINLPENIPFYSYPILLKIILENLLENAVNFCRPENAWIKIRSFEKNGFVIIEVEDNGEGIPKEYTHLIFDMYLRASNSSKGNGLGLYSVKKAVEKLNGHIDFKSTLHEGSIFTVSLPYQGHDTFKTKE